MLMIHTGIQCYCFKMDLTASSNQAINLLHPEQGANGSQIFPSIFIIKSKNLKNALSSAMGGWCDYEYYFLSLLYSKLCLVIPFIVCVYVYAGVFLH